MRFVRGINTDESSRSAIDHIMGSVAYANESCRTYEWAMAEVWTCLAMSTVPWRLSCVAHLNESRPSHAYVQVRDLLWVVCYSCDCAVAPSSTCREAWQLHKARRTYAQVFRELPVHKKGVGVKNVLFEPIHTRARSFIFEQICFSCITCASKPFCLQAI